MFDDLFDAYYYKIYNSGRNKITEDMKETPSLKQILDTTTCVECQDQPFDLKCLICNDLFCKVCFDFIHKSGSRLLHSTLPDLASFAAPPSDSIDTNIATLSDSIDTNIPTTAPTLDDDYDPTLIIHNSTPISINRASFIPLRLTYDELKYLRLLEAALDVSNYTDQVDVLSFTSKSRRIVVLIKELCGLLAGLLVASDYKAGQDLFQNRDYKQNEQFFQQIFELGRRNKIRYVFIISRNPEKMRNTYGKLMYILQDSQIPEIKEILQFNLVIPIKTVYSELSQFNRLDLLNDDLLDPATMEIIPTNKSRRDIQKEIKLKEKCIEILAKRYATDSFSMEKVRNCLYSIGDNNAFLRVNRDPCQTMSNHLKHFFNESNPNPSLSISAGRDGARLTHSHQKQFTYVIQSLSLWYEIQENMFELWYLADQDLLNESNHYSLRDTGQGLNRIQSSPKVSRKMHVILSNCQKRLGGWVGSSVIHLGDSNVPNSLMFIDKYTQVYRILSPLVKILDSIDEISSNVRLNEYTKTFGTTSDLKLMICQDFFKSAFDGSGADNFFVFFV